MEWEGKTIYDLLNFAKDEAVKINVIRKEMELELERIKLIEKETEIEEVDYFSLELRLLFHKYGIESLHALSNDAKITKNLISGFYINKER